jgi:8-amino-7-oxononanoate synthase
VLNHASLIDGARLGGAEKIIYPHLDLAFLEAALRERKDLPGAKVIVTESVFSMEGDVAPLGELVELAREHRADVVVDEAHATGVCGPQGRGTAAECGCEHDVLAGVYTCGKALASAGAFVCGSRTLREFLVNRARTFLFSTAMPPYLAGQIRAALRLARQADAERAHLREISALLRDALAARGLDCGASRTHIVPVILGTNEKALHVAARLQEHGFAAKAIRPPTVPAGTSRIRISLTCRITAENVRRIVAIIAEEADSLSRPRDHLSSTVHA